MASTLEEVTLALRNGITAREEHRAHAEPDEEHGTHEHGDRPGLRSALVRDPAAAISVDSATVHLPKSSRCRRRSRPCTAIAIRSSGAARPGDQVTLQGLSNDGLVEARGSAAVRPDGSFLIRTTLRSAFSDDGDLVLPARGRYGVASTEGGNATVYGIAAEDTRVALAQPRLVLQRKPGNKLHFAIRVPGGDQHVRVAIKLGTKTLAQGYATQTGRFFKTIVSRPQKGNLRAVVSVPAPTRRSRHPRPSASDAVTQSKVVTGPPRTRRPHRYSRRLPSGSKARSILVSRASDIGIEARLLTRTATGKLGGGPSSSWA